MPESEPKIIGFGMTATEKNREDIELLFGTPQERKSAKRKAYYAIHRARENESGRIWRKANSARKLATQAAYRAKNKEKIRSYRLWYYNSFERQVHINTCCCCGVKFTATKSDQSYCTRKCARKVQNRRRRLKEYNKICAFCGTEFVAYRRDHNYCHKNCHHASRREKLPRIMGRSGRLIQDRTPK